MCVVVSCDCNSITLQLEELRCSSSLIFLFCYEFGGSVLFCQFLGHALCFELEAELTPLRIQVSDLMDINEDDRLTSPQLIGSYLGGLSSLVQVGMTPSTQLKFKPASNQH